MAMTRAKASQVTAKLNATGSMVRGLDDKLAEFVSVKDFVGVDPTGVTDSTNGLKNAFEHGGDIYVPDGTYLIAAAGPNAGGVLATLTKSLNVVCSANAKFVAGTDLDNDMIRLQTTTTGYTASRIINVSWTGGIADQTGQKVSTSVPNDTDYPPLNPGASATASFLAIDGEISVAGVPTQGFTDVDVKGVVGIASSTGHWQSAGGDSCISLNGKNITVTDCDITGSRDSGIYPSGLSAGETPGITGRFEGNVFRGCWAGVTAKRYFDRISISNNVGINTAAVAVFSTVTGPSTVIVAENNRATNAWLVVRTREAVNGVVRGNISRNHGHLLEGGVVPSLVFTASNACVRLSGSSKLIVSDNVCDTKAAGVSFPTATVRLDLSTVSSTSNIVANNTGFGIDWVVEEVSGQADSNIFRNNDGFSLSAVPVLINGAASINRDAKVVLNRGSDLIIASGVITATHSYHRVDTEGAAATDDLVTINGGVEGMRLILKLVNSGRDITLKHGTGNILLNGLADKVLSQTHDMIELIYISQFGFWCQLSFSDNGT
jgi:hypothetical protein